MTVKQWITSISHYFNFKTRNKNKMPARKGSSLKDTARKNQNISLGEPLN